MRSARAGRLSKLLSRRVVTKLKLKLKQPHAVGAQGQTTEEGGTGAEAKGAGVEEGGARKREARGGWARLSLKTGVRCGRRRHLVIKTELLSRGGDLRTASCMAWTSEKWTSELFD